ncbi:MFS transporter [Pseudobutyrivibrio xylanivorans]|uniref:Transmembrane secretion effector n=1 Tax=Pseudobutyrivibrio xylanivorans DSM 14809 TaxID=1123012 RepID=A0A1M6FQ44_PSEXY|nr:MFS transporter [Pseudobutyrivibrio xylanivorans]SHI99841.1 Transmembrane secretion effector [Pseudobutyrivibrio xylanivorans DSM 14809]
METQGKISYLTVLKQTNIRRLLISSVINRFGDCVDAIAFTWLVYQITGSATWTAVIFAMNQLPGVVLLPFAGAWVESRNKKKIIVYTDFIRGLIIAGFVCLFFLGKANPYLMILFTVLITTVESINQPAESAFVRELVCPEYYPTVQSLRMVAGQMATIMSTASAGVIIAKLGVNVAMLIDVATFYICGFIILFIKYQQREFDDESINEQSYMTKLAEGLKYIKRKKMVIYLCVVAVAYNFFLSPYNCLLTPHIIDFYRRDADFQSFCLSWNWTAAIVGSLIVAKVAKKYRFKIVNAISGVFIGVALVLFAIGGSVGVGRLSPFVFALTSMVLIGTFGSITSGVLNIEFATNVEQDYVARVSSVFNAFACASMPIGSGIVSLFTLKFNSLQIIEFSGIACGMFFGGLLVLAYIEKNKEKNYATSITREYQIMQKENGVNSGAVG